MRVALLLAVAVLAVAGAASARVTDGIEAGQALAFLNQHRAVNGIPPVATLTQSFSAAWCPDAAGGPSGGEEVRERAPRNTWDATHSPWDNLPLHQVDLYDPAFTQAGFTYVRGFSCAGLGGRTDPYASPTFFSFLTPAGKSAVPASETVVNETPVAPQQLVGLPQGTATGPNIVVYALGMGALPRVTAYSLTGPGGPVPNVLRAGPDEAVAKGYPASFFADSAVLIPTAPLRDATTYSVSVTWNGTATQAFSFRTAKAAGPPPAPLKANSIKVTARRLAKGRYSLFVVTVPVPSATLTHTGKTTQLPRFQDTGAHTWTLRFRAHPRDKACASSGGVGYRVASACVRLT